jgi:hypothetical protein
MENSQHIDIVDFLLALFIFVTFVSGGFCLWMLRREMRKKKTNQQDTTNLHGNPHR